MKQIYIKNVNRLFASVIELIDKDILEIRW